MARTAYFGKIYKKFNSTLQPDYSGWSEYDIVFKQGFDVDNPTRITPACAGNTLKKSLIYNLFPISISKFHLVSQTPEML